MRLAKWLTGVGLLVATTGCYTAAYGSAPGPEVGTIYVAGRRQNPAALWVCPAERSGEHCKRVKVELNSK